MEALIQATLEDGVLEDNEKAALIKRAQKEGIDLDELDIYINSLLQKRKRELNKENEAREEKHQQAKKEAFGQVCPNCGKQVPPLTLKCDCGYEFNKKNVKSSVERLYEALNSIELTEVEKDSAKFKGSDGIIHYDEDKLLYLKLVKKKEIISSFPVPNTKEDIVEFLALSAPNAQKKGGLWGTILGRSIILSVIIIICSIIICIATGSWVPMILVPFFGVFFGGLIVRDADKATLRHNELATIWKSKFDQVMIKARSLRGDPEFTQQLDYYENMVNPKK